MCVIAGAAAVAASASAFSLDPDIMIDRALNSPTLTVRYTGVNAVLVELRLNGESISTRAVSSLKASGETNFTLTVADLKDGDNEVEIRLYDRTGKLVGKDKTNISSEQSNRGPVFLQAPKIGAAVQGPVEIKVGFTKELRNSYVSFFVDGNFKSMTNYPPFTFTWDSEREANGWHEIEAWAIDETSETHKTKKVRVFVNNPGGRTNRVGVVAEPALARTNRIRTTDVVGDESGLRNSLVTTKSNTVSNLTAQTPKVDALKIESTNRATAKSLVVSDLLTPKSNGLNPM